MKARSDKNVTQDGSKKPREKHLITYYYERYADTSGTGIRKKPGFGRKNDLDTWFIRHFQAKTQKWCLEAKEKNQKKKFVRSHEDERISFIQSALQVINQEETGVIEWKQVVK